MKKQFWVWLAAALVLGLVGCADDVKEQTEDTGGGADTTDFVGFDFDVPTENLFFEPPDSQNEIRDCFTGCGHESPDTTYDYKSYAGIQGRIDGECHTYPNGSGPDIDIVEIVAPTRALLEIVVTPTQGSRMDPLITTHDGSQAMVYNDSRAQGDVSARAVLVSPFVNPLPVYVIIDEARNYEAFDPKQSYGSCDTFVGGEDYGWVMTITETAFAPEELGTLSGQLAISGELTQGGDLPHYRFEAPATSMPNVAVRNTGSASFTPCVVGMKTLGGDLLWQKMACDEDGDGIVLLDEGFRACETNCDGNAEFVFAVLDWEGASFPGSFTFDATVSL